MGSETDEIVKLEPIQRFQTKVEEALFDRGLSRMREKLGEACQRNYVYHTFDDARDLGHDYVHLGDYGNQVSFINDYELARVYALLGLTGDDGEETSPQSLWGMAGEDERIERPIIGGGKAVFIFSGSGGVNYDTWIKEVGVEQLSTVLAGFEQIPAFAWLRTVAGMIDKNELIGKAGEVVLDGSELVAEANDPDFIYLLTTLGVSGLNWEENSVVRVREMLGVAESERGKWRGVKVRQVGEEPLTAELETSIVGLKLRINERGEGGSLNLGFVIDTDELRGRNDRQAFIRSRTATELLKAFDDIGLNIDGQWSNAISEGALGRGNFSHRYGNGYAELCRWVVNDVLRSGSRKLVEKFEAGPEKITEMIESDLEKMSGPVRLILKMIKDKLGSGDGGVDEFKLWQSRYSISGDGACKDAEHYLVSEMAEGKAREDETFIYYYGGHTDSSRERLAGGFVMAMTRREIMVDGVRLPAGFLCRVSEDRSGVEPLRPSMFCFNEDESRDAFGGQYSELVQNIPWAFEKMSNYIIQ